MLTKLTFIFLLTLLFQHVLNSVIVGQKAVSLTIYNNNFAIVKDIRDVYIEQNQSNLYLSDVSPNIQHETVTFKAIGDGQSVKVYQQALVGGVLSWRIWSQRSKVVPCQIVYRTTGFQWTVDYTLIVNGLENKGELGAWVMIENNSGKKYQNAQIKLVSGQINIVSPQPIQPQIYESARSSFGFMAMAAPSPPPPPTIFTQNQLSDFQIYTLNRPITLNQSSKKQVEFIPKIYNIELKKLYTININTGGYNEQKLTVRSQIQIINQKKNQLGIPLPKGIVRIYKQDVSDNSVEFIGESLTEHIVEDETIKLQTGNVYDIIANKIAKTKQSTDKNGSYNAVLNMKIINRKNIPVQVEVILNNMYQDNLRLRTNMMTSPEPIKISSSEYKWKKIMLSKEIWEFQWRQAYVNPVTL